jgi:hypothetical protein
MTSLYNEEKFATLTYNYTDAMAELLIRKQKDYGPKNIASAPGGALNGLLVRMHDKIARLNHLIYETKDTPKNEPIEDSFIDLLNYSAIALMVLRGKWHGVPSQED